MANDNLLELRHVSRHFGGLQVLRDVSFSVPQGGLCGLIGPNGSGKTTLFNIISGYVEPSSGGVSYQGAQVDGLSVQQRYARGMVRTFQTPKIFDQMTVLENVMVGYSHATRSGLVQDLLRLPGSKTQLEAMRAAAEEACLKFDLGDVRNVLGRHLSAGRRRIVELARATVRQPKLLLLDEPSSGLNDEEIRLLRGWIELLWSEGVTIVLVSHDMPLMSVAQEIHVLYFGQIIASEDMGGIQSNPRVREIYLGEA